LDRAQTASPKAVAPVGLAAQDGVEKAQLEIDAAADQGDKTT